MQLKPTQVILGTLALAATVWPLQQAGARPAFRAALAEQYLLVDKDGKFDVTCQYCHTAATGGPSWNGYGTLLREHLKGDAKGNLGDALYLTLKADKDSDKDGYSDALEVFAKTLPGSDKSKPEEKLADLEKAFEKAGGVDQYKPKTK